MRFRFAVALLAPLFFGMPASGEDENVFTQIPRVAQSQVEGESKAEIKTTSVKDFQGGPTAEWIWSSQDGERCWLRKEFDADCDSAAIMATCDNRMSVMLNGERVLQSGTWEAPVQADVTRDIKSGKNVLLVRAENAGGISGFALKLVMKKGDKRSYIVTDTSWKASRARNAKSWVKSKSLGKMGVKPWGDVFAKPKLSIAGGPRDVFQTLPGFQVESLFTVPKDKLGSWVCITFDPKGRLIASDQGGKGLCRITPPPIGSKEPTKVERMNAKISSCQGMLYAFGKLYCSVNGGPGSGFYVLDDAGDGNPIKVTKLKEFKGGGEHGPHAIRLSPDGKSLYVIAGNHTDPPKDFDRSRLPSNWDEDLLLPRQWDARGHARGKLAPGGWIAKTDPAGKTWEIVSSGYRNPYDMDFNADGELFAYDADMEWDLGSPWYRPTRVCHAVSGSEFGWRSGTGKWPVYFPDSLPPVVNIGPGSPVGVEFGYGTKFPAKYQRAMYILDWTFGTIYAIHLTPNGASYDGVKEEFVSRTPLPLTDAAVGPDGALYFTVGGRGTQSELFRVTYVGEEPTAQVDVKNSAGQELRATRRELEEFHTKPATRDDVHYIAAHLEHEDRFIRYAARVALLNAPVKLWQDRVLSSEHPVTAIEAAIALARIAKPVPTSQIVDRLAKIDFAKLTEMQQLALLRAYSLTFIRGDKLDANRSKVLAAGLDKYYPAKSDDLNRELSKLLVYLGSPTVITKTLKLFELPTPPPSAKEMSELLARNPGYGGTIAKMLANQPELQKIHYALQLRNVKYGWTLGQRKQYFEWLAKAREKSGGASYQGFIDNIRKEALENATEAERKALERTVALKPPALEELPKPAGPGKAWTVDDLVNLANTKLADRDFANGRKMYAATQCVRCHRFGGDGGATGPDLTNLAGRFRVKDLAEAIVEPNKVISDQYRAHKILTTDGKPITGRVLSEAGGKVEVLTDPVDATKIVTLNRDDIQIMTPSKTSLMPAKLLNELNEREVLDLLAYLLSRGNPDDPMFAK